MPGDWGLLIQVGNLESGHGMGGAKMRNTRYRGPCGGVVFGPHGLSKVNVIVGAGLGLQINPDSLCVLVKLLTVPSLGHTHRRIHNVTTHSGQ